MKKLVIIILFLGVFNACDFLDEEPLGLPAEENFYRNVNELWLGLNAVYETMINRRFQIPFAYIGSGCGDNMVAVEAERFSLDAELFTLNANALDQNLEDFWFQNYLGVFRANKVIEGARGLVLPTEDAQFEEIELRTRQIVGEAKVLRAFFYFNLVRTFGGVPIKEEVLELDGNEDNFKQARASKEEVYAYIEKDLREAAIALDALSVGGNIVENLGRVTEGTALSLLLKVLVYQAQPGIRSLQWELAQEISEHLVMGASQFSYDQLLRFEDLYSADPAELQRIKSDLFYTDLDDESFLGQSAGLGANSYSLDFQYAFLNQEQADFNSGSVFEVNHVLVPDGSVDLKSPFHENVDHVNKLQPISALRDQNPDDPRLKISVVKTGDNSLPDGTNIPNPPFPEKTACYKWYTLSDQRSEVKNFRIMRYAEVVLFHAEVLNELGDQIGAIAQLNTLRTRARRIIESGDPRVTSGISPVDYDLANYTVTRTRIRTERRIELCFEFDRYWDLIRSGEGTEAFEVYNQNAEAVYRKNFREGISEVFPIPQKEIDASGGLVTQNPGY